MDMPCKKILKQLGIVKGLSLSEVVEQTGLSRKTVFDHLKHLVQAGLVTRDNPVIAGKNSRGRPKVLYRKKRANTNSQKMKQAPKRSTGININQIIKSRNSKKHNLPSTVAVEVEFKKLQKLCRNEKGGKCKQKFEKFGHPKCALSICPLVLHARLSSD